MAEEEKKSYYGKRPLWQWVLLYLVIGGIIYAVIYYSGALKNLHIGGYNYGSSNSNSSNSSGNSNYNYSQ